MHQAGSTSTGRQVSFAIALRLHISSPCKVIPHDVCPPNVQAYGPPPTHPLTHPRSPTNEHQVLHAACKAGQHVRLIHLGSLLYQHHLMWEVRGSEARGPTACMHGSQMAAAISRVATACLPPGGADSCEVATGPCIGSQTCL